MFREFGTKGSQNTCLQPNNTVHIARAFYVPKHGGRHHGNPPSRRRVLRPEEHSSYPYEETDNFHSLSRRIMVIPQERQRLHIAFSSLNSGKIDGDGDGSLGTNKSRRCSPEVNEFTPQTNGALPILTLQTYRKGRNDPVHGRYRCCSYCSVTHWVLVVSVVTILGTMEFLTVGSIRFTREPVRTEPNTSWKYKSVQGIDDLKSSSIQPRCFKGETDCDCVDPLIPQDGGSSIWMDTHVWNTGKANDARYVDVVFLGDSITERWHETEYGKPESSALGSTSVFESLFSKRKGTKYDGLALGISGDTSPMLLWRLQNGELSPRLNPSVFWVLVGTNDIGRTWCSAEFVVVGVIRNVEEILLQKPKAKVVINGILPFTYNPDGYVAKGGGNFPSVWEDIQAINSELKAYATHRDRVSFFETKIFFQDPMVRLSQLQIDQELMPDYVHPSPLGYRLWGEEIVQTLDVLFSKGN